MQVEQGSPAVIWAHFLKQTGEEATITGTPTVTIRHWQVNTSSLDTDVNAVNMIQASGSLYYYIWNYATIVKSSYAATVSATYDTGESVTGTQTFTINNLKIIGAGVGVWTLEEKKEMINTVNKIVEILKDVSNDNKLNSEIDNIKNTISNLISQTKEIKGQDNYVDKLKTLEKGINTINEDMVIQNKILMKISDLNTLEEMLKEGGKT